MEKIIVRITIFTVALYMLAVLIFAWQGYAFCFKGHIILLDYCLYRLACDEGKYHCKYARALPLNLLLTDTLVYLDDIIPFMPSDKFILIFFSFTWAISTSVTIYLGISHFKKVRKLKNKKKKVP